MKISFVRKCGPEFVTGALRATTGKKMKVVKPPSIDTWRKLLYTAGGVAHSPMRAVEYRFYLSDIASWTTVHLIRHKIGFDPYVKSQRDDRNKDNDIPRAEKPQGELISMMFDANVNALLNIGKARLCGQASKETREIVRTIKNCLLNGDEYDKVVGEFMRPPCKWYNGMCFEIQPCR
jgi:hypothetical protein